MDFDEIIERERNRLPRFTNCVFWTTHMLRTYGGYGLIRRGHNGVPLHCLWTPDREHVASVEPLTFGRHWHLSDTIHGDLLLLFRPQIIIGDEWQS